MLRRNVMREQICEANPERNTIMSSSQGHFIWYELATTNVETAKAFYTKVVGWGAQSVAMPGVAYTLFTAGGAPICGLMSLPEDARELGYRPTWLGYIAVDDVDFTAGRIAQLGGEIHVPPKEIPNVSRFAVAVDPQRVTIAVFKWLDGGGQQPSALDAPGHVGWHELLAADRVKAFAFYAELFGWQKVGDESRAADAYQLFSAGGQTIGGICTKPAAVPFPFWLYCFNVPDIGTAMARVNEGGGEILDGPFEVPDGNWMLRCTDPQGAIFALLGKRSGDTTEQHATSQVRCPLTGTDVHCAVNYS
jgi:predicted enzyme related to lactoylglutathione lyase